jgi:peptide/nickel transport system substrate-binding protein
MTTPSLVAAFRAAHLQVTPEPSSSVDDVELNTLAPPFNNIKAREALYYATNASALDRALNGDDAPVSESFTSPTDLFYEPKVPGYRTYDLAKAKALVRSLGGLSFTLLTGAGSNQPISEGLQAMYQAAGMKVDIVVVTLSQLIQDFQSHHWQAALQGAGGFDPASSFGLTFRYGCHAPFSGVCNPTLDALMAEASTVVAPAARAAIYHKIALIVSEQAYDPFLFPAATFNIAARGVSGPGLTTTLPVFGFGPEVLWQDVQVPG